MPETRTDRTAAERVRRARQRRREALELEVDHYLMELGFRLPPYFRAGLTLATVRELRDRLEEAWRVKLREEGREA